MASKNDITGDVLVSRANTKQFEDNFDRIFRKKSEEITPCVSCEVCDKNCPEPHHCEVCSCEMCEPKNFPI